MNQGVGDRRERPSRIWYWVAGVIVVAGVAAAVAFGVSSFAGIQQTLAGFPRTSVPGEVFLEVANPQELKVFYVAPRAPGGQSARPPLTLHVWGPDGEQLATTRYSSELQLDTLGEVAIAFASFDAPAAGRYRLAVDGEASDKASVAVGPLSLFVVLVKLFGSILLALASVAGGLVIAVTASRRRGPTPAEQPTPPLVPVG